MKPILFNTDMVRAILDGQKTVTRRIIKPQPGEDAPMFCYAGSRERNIGRWRDRSGRWWTPPCSADDILWVREAFMRVPNYAAGQCEPGSRPVESWSYYYWADKESPNPDDKWRPSIHMPREAARLFLLVTSVRVDRLQNITEAQAEQEGIRSWTKDGKLYKYAPADREGDYPAWKWWDCPKTPQDAMTRLWNSTIKPADMPLYGWAANPWVWVIEFERISGEEADNGD